MLEAILSFITPGSLTLPSKFSWRVVTSWITCGWILGIIAALLVLFQPSPGVEASSVLFSVIVGFPLALCFYGFLGLAVDLARGNKLIYSGWYWYFYPWITPFWIVVLLVLFGLGIAGLKFPSSKKTSNRYLRKPSNAYIIKIISENEEKIKNRKEELERQKAKILAENPTEKELEKNPEARRKVEEITLSNNVIEKFSSLVESLGYERVLLEFEELFNEEEQEIIISFLEDMGLVED